MHCPFSSNVSMPSICLTYRKFACFSVIFIICFQFYHPIFFNIEVLVMCIPAFCIGCQCAMLQNVLCVRLDVFCQGFFKKLTVVYITLCSILMMVRPNKKRVDVQLDHDCYTQYIWLAYTIY